MKPLKTDKVLPRLTRLIESLDRGEPASPPGMRRDSKTGGGSPYDRLLGIYPNLRQDLISATEQALGMMAECEVTLTPQASPAKPATNAIQAVVRVAAENQSLTIDVGFGCADEAAAIVTARMRAVHSSEVSNDDKRASLAELANVVAGRLQKGLVEHGCPAQCSAPSIEQGLAAAPHDLGLEFRSEEREIAFTVTLRAARAAVHSGD